MDRQSPKIQHIAVLAPPDLNTSRAMREAAAMARHSQAALSVLLPEGDLSHALKNQDLTASHREQVLKEYERRRDERLGHLMADLHTQVAAAQVHRLDGHPIHQAILDWQQAQSVDLLIKDVESDSRRRVHFLTPLDWQLLRASPSPLFILGPEARPGPVVAALDLVGARDKPLTLDGEILRWSRWLAAYRQKALHTVHAFESVENLRLPFGFDRLMPESDLASVRHDHQTLLDHVADANAIPDNARHLIDAPPGRGIPDLCRSLDAETLVLGSVRHNRLERLVMGSTAEAIIHTLEGDLLAIPPQASDSAD